jgi:hypothetical protein
LGWAKENVDQLVWDFINQNRDHLEHKGDYEPNKVYPSRRSWDRLNKVLEGADLLESPGPELFALSVSFVGFEAAVAFNDFAANYDRQVTVEQLLRGEREETLAGFGLNEHCALIEKCEAKDLFKQELSKEQLENLGKYFLMLPSEAAMKLWDAVACKDGVQSNVINFHKTEVDGVEVGNHLAAILGSE